MQNLIVDILAPQEIERFLRRTCKHHVYDKLKVFLAEKSLEMTLVVRSTVHSTPCIPKTISKSTTVYARIDFPRFPEWQDMVNVVGSALSDALGGNYNVEVRESRSNIALPYTRPRPAMAA